MKYDFEGWATKNDLRCSDGRVIRQDAFKHNDGMKVPLVWNHQHNDPGNIIGSAWLENRQGGVWTYGSFNNNDLAREAKEAVRHGDICSLSIYANHLTQNGNDVMHGDIKEVSLVIAGANPGAYIKSVLMHGEDEGISGVIYTGENIIVHADEDPKPEPKAEPEKKSEEKEEKSMADKTVKDVFDTLTEEQKNVVYALIGAAMDGKNEEDEEDDMKHSMFRDEYEDEGMVLSHDDMQAICKDAQRLGSMKEAFLAHGIDNMEYIFREDHNLNPTPEFIGRDTSWVAGVLSGVHHTPFSKVKSVFADITEDDARAKGYIKGNFKKEQVFSLLKRSTSATTIYKKQKMDRDDILEIDFDHVPWLKKEMRGQLDEEIARGILVGDGRPNSSDDKIPEDHLRPIWKDEDLFTIKVLNHVATADANDPDKKARQFIRSVIKSRKDYRGSGNPALYTTEDMLTDCLLLEDGMGRPMYDTEEKLRTALRVSKIVTVPVMEGLTRQEGGKTIYLDGIIVNLNDYNVGADKGGEVNMFDDFDLNYNAQLYLIETRISGALTKPFSAMAIEHDIV